MGMLLYIYIFYTLLKIFVLYQTTFTLHLWFLLMLLKDDSLSVADTDEIKVEERWIMIPQSVDLKVLINRLKNTFILVFCLLRCLFWGFLFLGFVFVLVILSAGR